MKKLQIFHLFWKVWQGTLSIDEFSFLVGLVDDNAFLAKSTMQMWAKKLLRIYFKRPLQKQQADILAKASLTVQDVWLESVCGRKLTDIELEMLVERMPWHSFRRFPVKLSDEYLQMLFATRNPRKIVAYCRDFVLPENFEQLLMEKYQQSLEKSDFKMQYRNFSGKEINGWAEALKVYLQGTGQRFMSSERQKQLLEFSNEELLNLLVKRCSIVNNDLHIDTLWYLVEQRQEKALRLLLKESYLPNVMALLFKIEKEMPELKYQIYIAQKRRELYFEEKTRGVYLGALTLRPREEMLILKYCGLPDDDKSDFAEDCIFPWLKTFGACMCAYLAYYFPQIADQLWRNLKNQ